MSGLVQRNPGGEFLLYQTEDGRTRVRCRLQDETLWLTQQQMADLFGVDKSRVSRHLKNLYESGELSPEATVAFYATVRSEGNRQVNRNLEHYNLDAIISVGYRVNQRVLSEPSPAKKHFIEAAEEVRQLEDQRKLSGERGGK